MDPASAALGGLGLGLAIVVAIGVLVSVAHGWGRDGEHEARLADDQRHEAEAALAARLLAEQVGRVEALAAEVEQLRRFAAQRERVVDGALAEAAALDRAARPRDGGAPDHARLLDAVAPPGPSAGGDPRPGAASSSHAPGGVARGPGGVAGDGAGAAPRVGPAPG